MREILFRGKAVETREWVYGLPIRINESAEINAIQTVVQNGELVEYAQVPIMPGSLGQFTNAVDIKGSKIFEGDVLENYDPYHYVDEPKYVVYFDEYFGAFCQGRVRAEGGQVSTDNIRRLKLEVVDNVFDNREGWWRSE